MRLMTCVLQTGSRLARLACETKRSVREAAAGWARAGRARAVAPKASAVRRRPSDRAEKPMACSSPAALVRAARSAADGDPAPPRAHPATAPASAERVEQRLGFLKVRGLEAFGEPAVDRREEVVRLSPLAAFRPKPAERRGGAEHPM